MMAGFAGDGSDTQRWRRCSTICPPLGPDRGARDILAACPGLPPLDPGVSVTVTETPKVTSASACRRPLSYPSPRLKAGVSRRFRRQRRASGFDCMRPWYRTTKNNSPLPDPSSG